MKKINSLIWSMLYVFIYFVLMNIIGIFILYVFKLTGYAQNANPLTLFLSFNKILYFVVITISIALFVMITRARNRKFLDFCGFKSTDNKLLFYCVILILGLMPVISIITSFLSSFFKSYGNTSNSLQLMTRDPIMILFMIIFIPIIEEIIFRGLILNEIISSTKNFKLAIIFQAILFGIVHGNIVQSTYAFILGLVLGAVAYFFQSIYLSIVMHCVFNLMGSIVMVKISTMTNSIYLNQIFVIIVFIIEFICLKMAISYLHKEVKLKKDIILKIN